MFHHNAMLRQSWQIQIGCNCTKFKGKKARVSSEMACVKERSRQPFCSVRDEKKSLNCISAPTRNPKKGWLAKTILLYTRFPRSARLYLQQRQTVLWEVLQLPGEALQCAEWRNILAPLWLWPVTTVITGTEAAEATALKCWGPPTWQAARLRIHIFATMCTSRKHEPGWARTSAPVMTALFNTDVLPLCRYEAHDEGQDC